MAENLSRSAQKRRFKQMEAVAEELSQLSASDISHLSLNEAVKQEVLACRGVKGGARKRQVKYLAKVMREEDCMEEVLAYLARHKGSRLKADRLHHEAERLRDLLISEVIEFQQQVQRERSVLDMEWDGNILIETAQQLEINERELRQPLYQYARGRGQNHYREVFRIVKAALEKKEREKRL